ncbi:hypothetical protein [Maribacter arcticus]|uniref:Uncharacterized protein n=1 Tax=Maribacter arcticus TaxID=561365 RepID=A0A1T5CHI1_9FLAO|nr:hypothetical protein [Maribacter arcticus]SKB58580.1 hypothetical protein SAMN05660866_02281 [Maribacter arcticus]
MIKSFVSRPNPQVATELVYKEIEHMKSLNYKIKKISRAKCRYFNPLSNTRELHFTFTIWFEEVVVPHKPEQ